MMVNSLHYQLINQLCLMKSIVNALNLDLYLLFNNY